MIPNLIGTLAFALFMGSPHGRSCRGSVLRGLRDGQSNKEIARALGLSESTVTFHVANLLGKLGSPNRTAAVVEAIRRGWIEV